MLHDLSGAMGAMAAALHRVSLDLGFGRDPRVLGLVRRARDTPGRITHASDP
jgi:hypothetical protein